MSCKILLIEDQPRDVYWLIDILNNRGYEVLQITNGQSGIEELDQIRKALDEGVSSYKLAIFDIKVAAQEFSDLSKLDHSFVEKSERMGLELCIYARETLGISDVALPIICLSGISDRPEVISELDRLRIPRFNKASQDNSDSVRSYLNRNLPRVTEVEDGK